MRGWRKEYCVRVVVHGGEACSTQRNGGKSTEIEMNIVVSASEEIKVVKYEGEVVNKMEHDEEEEGRKKKESKLNRI